MVNAPLDLRTARLEHNFDSTCMAPLPSHVCVCANHKGCTTSLTTDWVAQKRTGVNVHVHIHIRIYNECLYTYRQMYVCIYNNIYISQVKVIFAQINVSQEGDTKQCFHTMSSYVYTQLFTLHRLVKSDLAELFAFRTYRVSDLGRTLKSWR